MKLMLVHCASMVTIYYLEQSIPRNHQILVSISSFLLFNFSFKSSSNNLSQKESYLVEVADQKVNMTEQKVKKEICFTASRRTKNYASKL